MTLTALARAYGIQTAYYDVDHRRQSADPDSLFAVLRAAGAPIENEADIGDALRQRRLSRWQRPVEPVLVAWDGNLRSVEIRVPESTSGVIDCTLEVNGLEALQTSAQLDATTAIKRETVEGVPYAVRRVVLGRRRLPLGYHRLHVRTPEAKSEALVISAPQRAYDAFAGGRRAWGVFAPLYSLRSEGDWGIGSIVELERLSEWVSERDGSFAMTLPLLPAFLDRPFNPSPYSPVSRLFWNEVFIDVESAPELARSEEARSLVGSRDFQRLLRKLRENALVDYRRVMAAKRRVLELLSAALFNSRSSRRGELQEWTKVRPDAQDYAQFRAAIERNGSVWMEWPSRMREGRLARKDYDAGCARYHTYVQWLAEGQVAAAAERSEDRGVSLVFDMPIGVDRASFDVWRYRDSFAESVNAGAPPDAFFTRGQDWGFPPLSPDGERAAGYRYFRASIAHLLRVSGILRIDHVMGLHRLYWVPRGMPASRGAYVQYPAEELYAILSLESHRHQAAIMGEDLGTVPHFVRRTMSRHNLLRSYVLQFELPSERIRRPPRTSVASLNTHDMPPFAAFWKGADIDDRLSIGHIDEGAARQQRADREASRRQLLKELRSSGKLKENSPAARPPVEASIRFLMDSAAGAVLVNLEDLWLETEPQNMPGTTDERPNWRRKAARSLEELCRMDELDTLLQRPERDGKREVTK